MLQYLNCDYVITNINASCKSIKYAAWSSLVFIPVIMDLIQTRKLDWNL